MPETSPNVKLRFRFELKHVLYALTVFGASLGLCGLPGLILAPLVLLFWYSVFLEVRKQELRRQAGETAQAEEEGSAKPHPNDEAGGPRAKGFTLLELLVVIAIIGILIALLLPAVSRAPSWTRYWSNLQRISVALRAYDDEYGSLPPAHVVDEAGHPVHSWRVLILPQMGYQELYGRYNFDEPWDGPNNAKLLRQMPDEYAMAGATYDQQYMTAVMAVTGSETAWPVNGTRKLDELRDGASKAALLVESEAQCVAWTSPSDLTEAEAARSLTQPPEFPRGYWTRGFFVSTCYGRFVVTVDGSVQIASPSSSESVREFLRVSDGRPEASGDGLPTGWEERRWVVVHYGNFVRLAIFLVVALWPTIWLVKEMRRIKRNEK